MSFSANSGNANHDITNNGFFPTITTADFSQKTRLDGTVTLERIVQSLIVAISEVNQELTAWQVRQQVAGYATLADVPAPQLDGESQKLALYRQAVYALAKAELIERYRDFDSTKSGHRHADEMEPGIDTYRRSARWAIADIQAKPRMVVELI